MNLSLLTIRFATVLWVLTASLSADPPDFAADIQPIFAKHCFECHGAETQENNFRLDVRTTAFGGGDSEQKAIIAGDSQSSPLYRYVARLDPDRQMPPDGDGLSKQTVKIIQDWIDAGAKWPDALAGDAAEPLTTDHWSFQPIREVEPPTNSATNVIDRFIATRLAESGLSPSPLAAPVTLIRRVHLDMHGLPPTPQQVDQFVAQMKQSESPNKVYNQLIDEVLASHHYGERWARHWLDVVRFGESTGYEVNRDRENAFYYRDYVIDALNNDKPYSDFIIDQLAGDVVGDELGTGFLVGGPHDIVKSPDINLTLMQREDELADYVNTTSTAFLGLTVGCARCHNHKFDPVLQKDYYSMQAVFAGVQHGERPLKNEQSDDTRKAMEEIDGKLASINAELAKLKTKAEQSPQTTDNADPKLPAVNARGNNEPFAATKAKYVRFTITATNSGEPCIDELQIFSAADDKNVALASAGATATASGTLPGYANHKLKHINDSRPGNQYSWISNTRVGGWVQIELAKPTQINRIRWARDGEGQFSDRLATGYRIEVAASKAPGGEGPDKNDWRIVASSDRRRPYLDKKDDFVDRLSPDDRETAQELQATRDSLKAKRAELDKRIPRAYLGTFTNPKKIHRLYRGDPLQKREVVFPDALSVIGSLDLTNDTPEPQRRLALAKWIASPKNPLTARVLVNRVWHYHFGTGLVSTPSDFGKNGDTPSHPDMLDWLAANFMKNGWSLKWLHRTILTSHTYQQSSHPNQGALAKDADCRLLWRFPPRRLEAEAIRDCVLHASGSLNPKTGGRGFLLFEIHHENVHHYFPKEEFTDEEFRRMIYMTKIRQERDDVFGAFDCPDGGQVIPKRSRSTTPLQALNLLNSQFMLDQAETMARRVQREAGDSAEAQIRRVFELSYSRQPTKRELEICKPLVREHGLKTLCRVIFSSNEFLFMS